MSRASLLLASSLIVALPFFICSCKLTMSDCFFSSCWRFGMNLACRAADAVWPSLVCRIACCTLMMATLVGAAAWAFATAARPSASMGNTTKFFFKLKTPKCENTILLRTRSLKGPTDGEAEHRPLFVERILLSEGRNRVEEGRRVRKRGTVRNDRRLENLPDDQWIVRPIQPERRVHHRQHYLQFETGRGSRLLRPRRDLDLAGKARLRERQVQIVDARLHHRELARTQDLIDAHVEE